MKICVRLIIFIKPIIFYSETHERNTFFSRFNDFHFWSAILEIHGFCFEKHESRQFLWWWNFIEIFFFFFKMRTNMFGFLISLGTIRPNERFVMDVAINCIIYFKNAIFVRPKSWTIIRANPLNGQKRCNGFYIRTRVLVPNLTGIARHAGFVSRIK